MGTDSSYDPAIGDVSKNFGLDSAVTGRGRQVIGAPNMSYWGNLEDEKLREIPLDFMQKGVQQGMKDMQILFYSGASLAGEHLFDIVGGDDTSLRRVPGNYGSASERASKHGTPECGPNPCGGRS